MCWRWGVATRKDGYLSTYIVGTTAPRFAWSKKYKIQIFSTRRLLFRNVFLFVPHKSDLRVKENVEKCSWRGSRKRVVHRKEVVGSYRFASQRSRFATVEGKYYYRCISRRCTRLTARQCTVEARISHRIFRFSPRGDETSFKRSTRSWEEHTWEVAEITFEQTFSPGGTRRTLSIYLKPSKD